MDFPGHEGIELALVKLARVTGEVRYMSLAEYFVRQRGHSPSIFEKELENPDLPGGLGAYQHHFTCDGKYEGHYAQAHLPIQEQTECVGHAVRAMYLYSGAAEIAYETGGYRYRKRPRSTMAERRETFIYHRWGGALWAQRRFHERL